MGTDRERRPPGLWYSEHRGGDYWGWEMPERSVLQSWQKAAEGLCRQWNIVGVDLMAGLNAATWGKKEVVDWDLAAARLGNEGLTHCPRWLVLVHGIGVTPAAADAFDGANLAEAAAFPVVLTNPQKLVYVARLRGPSEGQRSYSGSGFPSSLEDAFLSQWSATQARTGAALSRAPACRAPLSLPTASPLGLCQRQRGCPPQVLPSSSRLRLHVGQPQRGNVHRLRDAVRDEARALGFLRRAKPVGRPARGGGPHGGRQLGVFQPAAARGPAVPPFDGCDGRQVPATPSSDPTAESCQPSAAATPTVAPADASAAAATAAEPTYLVPARAAAGGSRRLLRHRVHNVRPLLRRARWVLRAGHPASGSALHPLLVGGLRASRLANGRASAAAPPLAATT